MQPHPPRSLLPLLSWCLLVVARLVFHQDVAEALHFLLPLADLVLLVGGAGLAWTMWRPALLIVALLAWFPGQGWFGLQDWIGTRAWLLRNQGIYSAWIADFERGAAPAGPRVELVPGEPARVAFPMGASLLDNWQAIVHDPSGLVTDLEASREWFGGHLVYAEPLWDDWYRCAFS
ncbi:MAG: hypothetical protein H8E31_04100 [Planctomycetes bacterium]|nr:hypothetical protein [Planctomycetota bacterium]